jgi:hypothetical protein
MSGAAAKPTTMTGRARHEVHPAALAFPEMPAAELEELADDIKQNGLAHPIVRTREGLIIDGRNRLRACEIVSVEPRFEIYNGDNPIGFIVSSNLKRRHMKESQRAFVAAKLATLAHGANQGPSGKFAARPDVVKQAAAAAMLNVSERSVRHAAIVRDHGTPQLIKAVEQGKVSVSAAAKQAKPQPKPQPKPPQAKPQPHVAITLRQPVAAAYSNVQGAETMSEFRKALERLVKVAQDTLEKIR